MLYPQQVSLCIQSTGITHKPSITADNAMARHHYRHGVRPYCRSHGTHGSPIAQTPGQLAIRYSLAIRYIAKSLPYTSAKLRSKELERNFKLHTVSGKILI